jgi:transposase InsO family protein
MPWSKDSPEDIRSRFVVEAQRDEMPFSRLCAAYGISRETGYKWVSRYAREGRAGLIERSRAPVQRPHAISSDVAELLVDMRTEHPTWGPRKVLARLERLGRRGLPAASTVGELFKRRGLVASSKRRRTPLRSQRDARPPCDGPNDIWSVDFKGQFRLGNGAACFPLTIADVFSRYVFEIEGLSSTEHKPVIRAFERLFKEHGLPLIVRSDGGCPFASTGAGNLSRLGVAFIKLGIALDIIDPGRPDQNGAHERFHRTMKAETARPAAENMRAQQRVFDRFRHEYNHERPHEALGMMTPAEIYRPSPRVYPKRITGPRYEPCAELRKVDKNGCIKWNRENVFVSTVLHGELVGIEEVGDDCWLVHFGSYPLGFISGRVPKLRPIGRAWRRVSGMLPV